MSRESLLPKNRLIKSPLNQKMMTAPRRFLLKKLSKSLDRKVRKRNLRRKRYYEMIHQRRSKKPRKLRKRLKNPWKIKSRLRNLLLLLNHPQQRRKKRNRLLLQNSRRRKNRYPDRCHLAHIRREDCREEGCFTSSPVRKKEKRGFSIEASLGASIQRNSY